MGAPSRERQRIRAREESKALPECAAFLPRHRRTQWRAAARPERRPTAKPGFVRRSFFQGQINPEQPVLVFGARAFAVDFRRKVDRSLERAVINLEREHLDRTPFTIRRLRRLARSAQYHTLGLDR